MRKLLCMVFLLLLPAAALAQGARGQQIDVFLAYYEENVSFINQNTGRHLLPLVFASSKSQEGDGRMVYQSFGDVLNVTVRTDPSKEMVEMCQIILTAPSGMEIGNAIYNDFTSSGYHSYALLMAMDGNADPAKRYELVTRVEEGMKQNNGAFMTLEGAYNLTCTNLSGTVTLIFDSSLPAETNEPATEETLPDEGAGMG